MANFKKDLAYMLSKLPARKKIDFKLKISDKSLAMTTAVLDISQRTRNAIDRMEYFTIGDIIDNWDKLRDVKGQAFGKTAVADVKRAVIEYEYAEYTEEQIKEFWLRALTE